MADLVGNSFSIHRRNKKRFSSKSFIPCYDQNEDFTLTEGQIFIILILHFWITVKICPSPKLSLEYLR